MKLSIVIPVFNEEKRLPERLKPYLSFLEERFKAYELIFVDDGSNDGTLNFLNSLAKQNKNIIILRSSKNRGRGYGMRTGILNATGDYVLETDADLPVDPDFISKFVKILDDEKDC